MSIERKRSITVDFDRVSLPLLRVAGGFAVRIAAFILLAMVMGCFSAGEKVTSDTPIQTSHDTLLREKMQLAHLYLRLGEIYYQDLDDQEQSREYFLKYLEMMPAGKDAELARKRLESMQDTSDRNETMTVPSVPEGNSGTIILFWKNINPLMIRVLEQIRHLKDDGWGEKFRILHAMKDMGEDQAAYLASKGFDVQLIDDGDGELASRWGAEEHPSLVVLDDHDTILKRFLNWDGSGLKDLLMDIQLKSE